MVYERHANGHFDNDKHWWVQAEDVIGQLYLAEFHNEPGEVEKPGSRGSTSKITSWLPMANGTGRAVVPTVP